MINGRDLRSVLVRTMPAFVTAAALTGVGHAQSRMMVVEDDGGGPMVMHFSGPDLHALREPDFLRSDLPIFTDTLQLDDGQRLIVQTLLDGYVSNFAAQARARLGEPHPFMARRSGPGGHVGHAGDSAAGGGQLAPGEGGLGDLDSVVHGLFDGEDQMTLDVEAGPGTMAVMVGVGGPGMMAGGSEGGGESEGVAFTVDVGGGDGAFVDGSGASVMIAVDGPEGFEIPQEVLEKLEARAQEMAEKLTAQMEAGELGAIDDGGIPMLARMEEQRAQFEALAEKAAAFELEKRELKQAFVSDVQTNLTTDQLALWPDLERTLTRHKTLPKGRLDGESTDLFKLVDELEPALDEKTAEAVEADLAVYERALDDALVRRNIFVRDADRKIDEAIRKNEPEKALSTIDRASRLRVHVRDVNDMYAQVIAGRLEDEQAKAFHATYLEESFPRVHRTTRAQRAFEAAGRLSGLDERTTAAIAEMEQAYAVELDGMNRELIRMIRKHQPQEARRPIEHVAAMVSGDGGPIDFGGHDDDPVHAAYGRRADLDARYIRQLRSMLTSEQADTLPTPRPRHRGPIIINTSPEF